MKSSFSRGIFGAVLSGVVVCSSVVAAPAGDAGKAGKTARPAKAPGRDVQQAFDAAVMQFNAGNYPVVIAACDQILARYPNYEPAIHLQGRSYYRVNRQPEAYRNLSKLNYQLFDPETAFEFGMAAMTQGQWEPCFNSMARVPEGHALADLGQFYGATCGMRLKRYTEAEDMLERASVLPDKLAKLRALYLKHLEEMRLLMERQALARERQETEAKLAVPPKSPTGKDVAKESKDTKKKTPPAPAPAAPPAPYQHSGYQAVDRKARAGHTTKSQLQDFSGYSEKNATAETTYFRFYHGPLVTLPIKGDGGRLVAFGTQFYLGVEEKVTEGMMRRFVIEDTQSDAVKVMSQPSDKAHSHAIEVEATPWVEFPLPHDSWFSVFGDIFFNYPRFEQKDRWGYRTGGATLYGPAGKLSLTLTGSYTQNVDAKTKPVTSQAHVEGVVGGNLAPDISGDLTIRHDAFVYDVETEDGPDGSTAGVARIKWSLPLGASIELKSSIEQQKNNIVHGMDTWGDVAADGILTMGKAKAAWAPFSWLSVSYAYTRQQATWTVTNQPDAQETYDMNTVDFLEVQEFDAGLNMTF